MIFLSIFCTFYSGGSNEISPVCVQEPFQLRVISRTKESVKIFRIRVQYLRKCDKLYVLDNLP